VVDNYDEQQRRSYCDKGCAKFELQK
jgi:hypothetical protein